MSTPELETIAHRLRYFLAGESFQGNDDKVARAVKRLDEAVDAICARQVWNPQSEDFGNTEGKPLHGLSLEIGVSGFYLLAPLEMARAYRCPLSRHYQNSEILQRLSASLRYFETFIRPTVERQGTWYGWDIAIPRWLSQTLVLCGDDLPDDLRAQLLEALCATPFQLFHADENSGVRRSNGELPGGGANTMEVLLHLLLRAVATGNRNWADGAAAQTPIAMGVSPDGEGVQSDWSFHFHGRGINAAYGHICMASQALWIYLTRDTPWQCAPRELEIHVGSLREFFTQNAWRGRFSPYTLDRTIARVRGVYGETLGEFYLSALLLTLNSEPESKVQKALGLAAREWLEGRQAEAESGERSELDLGLSLLCNRLELPPSTPAAAITRFYPQSEYLIVRRPSWFAGVLMNSTRTASWKAINGEHIHGSSSAEFSLALMTDGMEWTNSTAPTMDWRRIPGVTRCDSIEPSPEGYGQSTFVGGLAGDDFAVLGLQYLLSPPAQKTLRANKSVFIAGDTIVMLGSAIECDAPDAVVTTLFNAPIIEGASYLHNGVALDIENEQAVELEADDTLLLRNVAVRVLTPAQLHIQNRCGSYAALNSAESEPLDEMVDEYQEVHRGGWVSVVVNHGVKPESGSYGALIRPSVEPNFQPPDDLQITHEVAHHRVVTDEGNLGGEVRFPGDWRVARGLSYPAAEPAQWGNLAQWQPVAGSEKLRLQLLPPLRYDRFPNRATEIFLPAGMQTETGPSITLGGKPWPKNIMPIAANGEITILEVERPARVL